MTVTMTLRPPYPVPERILCFGGFGAGKTTNVLHIAKRIPDVTFRVMDTDGAFDRMLTGENAKLRAENGGNVECRRAYEWTEYTRILDEYTAATTADDWIVVDMIAPAWEAVQDFFSEQVFGKGVEQFFLEARAAAKKGSAFDGRKDWGVINKLYRNWANQLCLKTRGHVYATAGIAAVQEDDVKEIKALFGRYGVKPTGQKENGHRFHSLLWAKRSAKGEWTVTTLKDRERVEMDGAVINDFAKDYLMGVAGWKMARA